MNPAAIALALLLSAQFLQAHDSYREIGSVFNGARSDIALPRQEKKPEQDPDKVFEPYYAPIAEAWKLQLREYASTVKHAELARGTLFHFKSADDSLAGFFATWNADGIYVTKHSLFWVIMSAKQSGAKTLEDAASSSARTTLPLIAHEFRHGLNEKEMKARFGFSPLVATLEDETLAFFDSIVLIREMHQKDPKLELMKKYQQLFDAWSGGPAGLKDWVRRAYAGHPLLRLDQGREQVLKEAFLIQAKIQKKLEQKPGPALASYLKEVIDPTIDMLRDEEKFSQWSGFYAEKMKELDRAWEKEKAYAENK